MQERLLLNARVHTMDGSQEAATAVGIAGDRIGFVGDIAGVREWAHAGAEEVDLGGACLLPGFVEAHNHMIAFGLGLSKVDVRPEIAPNMAALVAAVAGRARMTLPGEWVEASGYDHNRLAEGRHPTRHDLDAAAPNHPVVVVNGSGHMSVVNSRALAIGGITGETADPQGGHIARDDRGEATGLLQETAQNLVQRHLPETNMASMVDALRRCAERYLAAGITSSQTAGVNSADELRAHQTAAASGLPLRSNLMIGRGLLDAALKLGLRTGLGDDRLRVGPLKLFSDGSLIGRTAAVTQPFTGEPDNFGLEMMPQDELDEVVRRGHNGGFQVAIHAIGDRAIDMVLSAYERAPIASPRADHRHRIEHCGILTAPLIDRLARNRVMAVSQPVFVSEYGDGFVANLGRERAQLTYPFRSLLDAGVDLVFSSDCPVSDVAPLKGVQAAVTELTGSGEPYAPGEAIDALTALRCYTLAGARASFTERQIGSIEVGKLADLVVLGDDPTTVHPSTIASIPVLATMLGGETVYERPAAAAG